MDHTRPPLLRPGIARICQSASGAGGIRTEPVGLSPRSGAAGTRSGLLSGSAGVSLMGWHLVCITFPDRGAPRPRHRPPPTDCREGPPPDHPEPHGTRERREAAARQPRPAALGGPQPRRGPAGAPTRAPSAGGRQAGSANEPRGTTRRGAGTTKAQRSRTRTGPRRTRRKGGKHVLDLALDLPFDHLQREGRRPENPRGYYDTPLGVTCDNFGDCR